MSRWEESLTIYQSELESNSLFPTSTKTISPRKQPSLVVTLILIVVAIAFYGWGINESSKIVTGIVEAAAKEAVGNDRF